MIQKYIATVLSSIADNSCGSSVGIARASHKGGLHDYEMIITSIWTKLVLALISVSLIPVLRATILEEEPDMELTL